MAASNKRTAYAKELNAGDKFTYTRRDKITKQVIGCFGPYVYYFPVCNPSIAGTIEVSQAEKIYIDDS